MMDLEGKVAVVTGGAGGIGKALAERFAAEHMRLVVADVEKVALDATVDELRAGGAEAIGVVTDVTSFASVEALADAAYAAVRRGPRAGQQRRRRAARGPGVGVDAQRLGLGLRGQRVRRGPRHPGVRAPHARRRRGGHRRQHLVARRPDRPDARRVRVRLHQVRGHLRDRVPGRPAGGRVDQAPRRGVLPVGQGPARHRPVDVGPQPPGRAGPRAAPLHAGHDRRRPAGQGRARPAPRRAGRPGGRRPARRPLRHGPRRRQVRRYAPRTGRARSPTGDNPTEVHMLGGS